MTPLAIRIAPDGIMIDIRLTPRGGRDCLEGGRDLADGRRVLAARVAAVPEKGAANAALVALLAARFGVSKAAVEIVSGLTSRVKTVRVAGDPALLAVEAAALIGA